MLNRLLIAVGLVVLASAAEPPKNPPPTHKTLPNKKTVRTEKTVPGKKKNNVAVGHKKNSDKLSNKKASTSASKKTHQPVKAAKHAVPAKKKTSRKKTNATKKQAAKKTPPTKKKKTRPKPKAVRAKKSVAPMKPVPLKKGAAIRDEVAKIFESSAPARPVNDIDKIVFARMKSLGLRPILCSDAVFVRRAYLDVTGTLPTAEEAKAFIQNSAPNKRAALIDRLLAEPEHADYWAMKWSDILRIKAEFPVKLWPNAAQAYHHWVWESIAHNKPYDQFVRELLTSSGSNFRESPVNFYRAIQNKTPEGIAAAVALAFMGTRIDSWPPERRAGMAVFFSQVGYKPTSEWKEEIVFWDPLKSTAIPGCTAPGQDSVAKSVAVTNQIPAALAKPIREDQSLVGVFPDGKKMKLPPDRDPRAVFADWLIRPDNPWFARAIVNRTWAWIMGRGIIEEPDDIRPDNPPCNPKLLKYLEHEFVASRYNLKHLKRLIFTSATYQLSVIPQLKKPSSKACVAGYRARRLEAEVLSDALNEITGTTDLYTSAVPEPFTYIPKDMRAVAIADGSITSSFLTLFGRSARATGMENERINQLASPQWLYMLNSGQILAKLQRGPKLKALIASAGGKPQQIIEKLYLTILSRFPTDGEIATAEQYAKSKVARGRDVWIDLAWALINSSEFLLRH